MGLRRGKFAIVWDDEAIAELDRLEMRCPFMNIIRYTNLPIAIRLVFDVARESQRCA